MPPAKSVFAGGILHISAVDEAGTSEYNKNINGGMNYGSENTGVLEGIRTDRGDNSVRQQSDDTQANAVRLGIGTPASERNESQRVRCKSISGWMADTSNEGARYVESLLGVGRKAKISNNK